MKRILRLGNLDQSARSSFRPKLKGDKLLRGDGYTLLYLGSNSIVELRSQRDALASIHIVKQTSHTQRPVQLLCKGVDLRVMGQEDEELLTCSLINLVQCVHHSAQGFSDCVGLVFSSGPWALQCHVFQAKSPREVSPSTHLLQTNVSVCHSIQTMSWCVLASCVCSQCKPLAGKEIITHAAEQGYIALACMQGTFSPVPLALM